MNKRHISFKNLFIYLFSIIWSVVTLYPLAFTILSSFKDNTEIFSSAFSAIKLPTVFRYQNYVDALIKADMGRCLLNSVVISLSATLLVLVFASMASFILSRYKLKFNNVLLLYFMLGIMVPTHSTLVPLVRIVNSLHAQNNYIAIILLYTTFNLPLALFLITGHMKGISKSMDEAAIIDGCGPLRLYSTIIMPLTMPAISTAGIITFLYIYNDLLYAVVFISKKSMYTISLGMLTFVGSKVVEYGPQFASIILSILPMVVIYLLFQEKVENGLASGAIKE